MSELQWTAAAVLLAIAVLSDGTTRSQRATIVSWEDFARQLGLRSEPRRSTGEAPVRGRRTL
jgi:hypothetical protein